MSAAAARISHEVFVVEGMFCASCAAAVEATLKRQPGVIAASTHFAADAAAVEWDSSVTSLERLRAAVARLGYTVRTLDEPADSAAERKLRLPLRLVVAVFCGMWSMFATAGLYLGDPAADTAQMLAWAAGVLAAPALIWSGWPFYLAGWRTLRAGAPGLDTLILLGVFTASGLSAAALVRGESHVYFDTALLLISFQLIARMVDKRVRADAAGRVRQLLATAEGTARRITAEGGEQAAAPSELKRDDRIRLAVGDVVVADGPAQSGPLWVDRARLTGEAEPVAVQTGDALWAGDRITGGGGVQRVQAALGERRLDQLATQVRRLLTEKPAWQARVDFAARCFMPLSLFGAAVGAVLALESGASAWDAAARALAVIVIACPCALSLAVPLAATRAVAAAAGQGFVLRDLDAVQHYRRPDAVLLDKTGTLTVGRPRVLAVHLAPEQDEAQLRRWAGQAARASAHPLAQALAADVPDAPAFTPAPGRAEEAAGRGIAWQEAAGLSLLGSRAWLRERNIAVPERDSPHTEVHLARDGVWRGCFEFSDTLRSDAAGAVRELRRLGCSVQLISGDRETVVAAIARELDIPYAAAQTPEDKVRTVQGLRAQGQRVMFCGDGVNDGPALAAADLGVAVAGATGAAQAAAAVTLLRGGVEQLPAVLRLAERARAVMRQNLLWALAYNAAALPLAIGGLVHPALAAVAMSASTLTILLNTTRLRAERP